MVAPKKKLQGIKKVGQIKKNQKKNPGLPKTTHAELSVRSIKLGKVVRLRLKMGKLKPFQVAKDPADQGIVTKYLATQKNKISWRRFPRFYRSLRKGTDEFVATSLVRDLLIGACDPKPTPAQQAALDQLFGVLSEDRMPTEESGYTIHGKKMQHPTNSSKALFATPKGSGSAHSEEDIERKRYVVESMEAIAKNQKASAADIILAGGAAGLEHTLCVFDAPITASNVKPYSLQAKTANTDPRIKKQILAREACKKIYEKKYRGRVEVKPPGETKAAGLSRPWNKKKRANRSLSPFRRY